MDKELNKCGCNSEEKEGCGCGGNCGCGSEGHEHKHDNCGCGEEHEHEHFVVDLVDDEGNEISCPIMDAFEYEGTDYVLAQHPEDGSVFLFKLVVNGEEEELVVPEEEEFDRVAKYYEEAMSAE